MELTSLALLMAGGFIGGFFGAAVGSAGLVSFPILIFLGMPPHAVVATTRPAAIILEFMSALRFWREGKIKAADLKKGLFLGIFGALGGAAGAQFIGTVSDQTLRLLFAVVIASMCMFLFLKRDWGMHAKQRYQNNFLILSLVTLMVGVYGGFFGFTFGTMMAIGLVACGFDLLQSAVLSRIIGFMTACAAAVVFAFQGTINYPYAIALGIGFGIGAWFGAGEGVKRGNAYIKKILIGVVLASVIKLLFDYFYL